MKLRFRFTLLFFIFLFLLIDVRLYYWQVVRAEELSELGRKQYGAEIKLLPQRGAIKTSDGFSLAANKISYLLYANPKEINEVETAATLLSPLLKIETSTLSASLSRNSFWSPLKTQIGYFLYKY